MNTVNPHLLSEDDFILYEDEFGFAEDSQWGQVVLQLIAGERDEGRYQRDPEVPIRSYPSGYHPSDIYLGKRQYTDVALGMLDGPARDNPKGYLDLFQWSARSPKATLTKRQRAKLRRAKRRAKRKGEAFNEDSYITLTFL